MAERLSFSSQAEYEELPTAPWFGIQCRLIPNHPDLPVFLQQAELAAPKSVRRIIRRTQRAKGRERQQEPLKAPLPMSPPPVLYDHEDFYSDWMDATSGRAVENAPSG